MTLSAIGDPSSLGFDAAISEVVSGKGEKYDSDVVDALVLEYESRGRELFTGE